MVAAVDGRALLTTVRAWLSGHRPWVLAAAGGAVFALSAPPTDWFVCVFIGLGLLAAAMEDATRLRSGLGRGALWATAAGLVGLRFVPSVIQLFTDLGSVAAAAAHVALAAGQSLTWALGMAVAAAAKRWLRAPLELAMALGVLITLWLPSIFVWSPAGLISPWVMLVQGAELIGERGVSVLFAVIGALAVRTVRELGAARRSGSESAPDRRKRAAWWAGAGAIGLLGVLLGHGAWAMGRVAMVEASPGSDVMAVGLVHAGVDPKERWRAENHGRILRTLKAQTAAVEREGVELSVWPEAAYPYRMSHGARRSPRGSRSLLGAGVRGPILFGLIMVEPARYLGPDEQGRPQRERIRFNSATLVTQQGALAPPYDKMQLLWFGETVPLGEQLPWLRRTFQRSGTLLPGRELRRLDLEREAGTPAQMGVLNCYEDTLPGLGRRIGRELQPNLLVNVTNDAWFIGTSEPELHLRLSAMRAIELRRDLVRAVNLGVAGWIDARGVVRARYDSPEPGYLVVHPQLRSGRTTYTRFGDVPLALLLAAALAAGWWRTRQRAGRDESAKGAPAQ